MCENRQRYALMRKKRVFSHAPEKARLRTQTSARDYFCRFADLAAFLAGNGLSHGERLQGWRKQYMRRTFMFQHLLVPLDGSEQCEKAIPLAARFALMPAVGQSPF